MKVDAARGRLPLKPRGVAVVEWEGEFLLGPPHEGEHMTESEWLGSTCPRAMLEFLRGKASNRKLRLFGVACCRRVWHLLADERSRKAVEVTERYAEGEASQQEVSAARSDADLVLDRFIRHYPVPPEERGLRPAAAAAKLVARPTERTAALAEDTTRAADLAASVERSGLTFQANLLRCVFGNPFRPVAVNPSWLAWNDGVVKRLAEDAYRERSLPGGELDVTRLAILADALEEVGADAALSAHLRGPAPHVRGCFVLDLLTGRV